MSAPTRSLPATIRMAGQVSSVVTPSSRRAMGRRARWSMSSSVSNSATAVVGEDVEQLGDGGGRPHPGVDPALEADHHHRTVEAVADRLPPLGIHPVERRGVVIVHSDSTSASARSPSRPTWAANWSTPERSPAAAPPA